MYEAEGFAFYTKKDAELAIQEHKKAEYLRTHMDFQNPESVLRVYKKAVNERLFKTPVGISFLKDIQSFLCGNEAISSEEIPAIPLYASYDNEVRENVTPVKNRIQPAVDKQRNRLVTSVILNIALVAALIAMFAIALNANQPNVLNYERVITDKYSSWEQQLTEREQVIRAKELELKLNAE